MSTPEGGSPVEVTPPAVMGDVPEDLELSGDSYQSIAGDKGMEGPEGTTGVQAGGSVYEQMAIPVPGQDPQLTSGPPQEAGSSPAEPDSAKNSPPAKPEQPEMQGLADQVKELVVAVNGLVGQQQAGGGQGSGGRGGGPGGPGGGRNGAPGGKPGGNRRDGGPGGNRQQEPEEDTGETEEQKAQREYKEQQANKAKMNEAIQLAGKRLDPFYCPANLEDLRQQQRDAIELRKFVVGQFIREKNDKRQDSLRQLASNLESWVTARDPWRLIDPWPGHESASDRSFGQRAVGSEEHGVIGLKWLPATLPYELGKPQKYTDKDGNEHTVTQAAKGDPNPNKDPDPKKLARMDPLIAAPRLDDGSETPVFATSLNSMNVLPSSWMGYRISMLRSVAKVNVGPDEEKMREAIRRALRLDAELRAEEASGKSTLPDYDGNADPLPPDPNARPVGPDEIANLTKSKEEAAKAEAERKSELDAFIRDTEESIDNGDDDVMWAAKMSIEGSAGGMADDLGRLRIARERAIEKYAEFYAAPEATDEVSKKLHDAAEQEANAALDEARQLFHLGNSLKEEMGDKELPDANAEKDFITGITSEAGQRYSASLNRQRVASYNQGSQSSAPGGGEDASGQAAATA